MPVVRSISPEKFRASVKLKPTRAPWQVPHASACEFRSGGE